MTTAMARCPCGLTQEQIERYNCVVAMKCTAPRLDDENQVCGELLGRHPSSTAIRENYEYSRARAQPDANTQDEYYSSDILGLLRKMDKNVEEIKHKTDEMQDAIKEGNYLLLDPWNDLTATSIGKSKDLKNNFLNKYGLNHSTAFCMISGIVPPHYSGSPPNLVLAHLLPRSTKLNVLDALGMSVEDVDDLRNTILLCKGIEVAFDRKEVSIVPIDNPFVQDRFKLMFWDDRFKNRPLYPGSTETIGAYENCELKLDLNGKAHRIFHRVISYQAYMACRHWFRNGIRKELPTDCDISEYQGSYQNSRKDFADQFRKALEKEKPDEDE